MTSAMITGLSGLALTADERRFYADAQPAGVILFKRNIDTAEQLRALVEDVRAAVGRDDFLVLIDQEGGRVQRLKPPLARNLPPAARLADLYGHDPDRACAAAFSVARLSAHELVRFGINMNCAPVVDVPVDGAHDIIGDRAYGRNPPQIIALARAVARGLLAGGVVPVIKHIPGHGRATADSHLALPVVTESHDQLARSDFVPFRALADLPAAMTAHVVFPAIDAREPASTSARVIAEVIRGEIGFDGLLMSDDLSMQALNGPLGGRADAVIRAGCDVALHCNGDLAEMQAVAEAVPQLTGRAATRFAACVRAGSRCEAFDEAEAVAILESLLPGGTAAA